MTGYGRSGNLPVVTKGNTTLELPTPHFLPPTISLDYLLRPRPKP